MNKFLVSASIVLIFTINCLLADKRSAINLLTLHASCRDKATNPEAVDEWKLDDKSVVDCYLMCMMGSPMTKVFVNGKFDDTGFVDTFDTEDLKAKARACVADHPVSDDDLCGTVYDVYYCVFKSNPVEAKRAYFAYFNTTAEEERQAMPEFEAMMVNLKNNE